MPRKSLQQAIGQRRSEADPGSDRFVDLDLTVLDESNGSPIYRVGGRWDRRTARSLGPAPTTRAIRVHRGQLDATRWFDGWLGSHIAGTEIPPEERVYSVMLGGGQRSGKTWLGVAMAASYAVAVAKSIVWIVSPSAPDHEEVQDYLHGLLRRSWYHEHGAPWFRFTLANGSRIVLRSGHEPDKLKKGDADLVVINEAQQQNERAFAVSRGRIAASGGLVIVCANPPSDAIGQWVGNFAVEAQSGLRQAKFFHLDPMDNPHIDQAPLLAMAKEFDQETFDREIRGIFGTSKGAVLYNWSRLGNERTPDAPEITSEFLQWAEGRGFDRTVGVDVQKYPHMASVEFRFFENPLAMTGRERFEFCHMWATAELTLEAADEEALAQAWLEAGWDPDRTLIVCDASGSYQMAERDPLKLQALREKYKGRGSFDVFRRMGYRHIVKPDRGMERNPDVFERCRAATSRICTKVPGPHGDRFVFSDPKNRELNLAIRSWPTKNGQPMRTSKYSHRGDAFTYPIHRFFPRRAVPSEMPEVKVLQRSSGERMRGW